MLTLASEFTLQLHAVSSRLMFLPSALSLPVALLALLVLSLAAVRSRSTVVVIAAWSCWRRFTSAVGRLAGHPYSGCDEGGVVRVHVPD